MQPQVCFIRIHVFNSIREFFVPVVKKLSKFLSRFDYQNFLIPFLAKISKKFKHLEESKKAPYTPEILKS